MATSPSYTRIYAAVRRVPRGRVATYGQIAALAGLPGHALDTPGYRGAHREIAGRLTSGAVGLDRRRTHRLDPPKVRRPSRVGSEQQGKERKR